MASKTELQEYARSAARRYGIPEEMFLWQIGAESGWDVNAKNPKSTATGIAQFIDGTAKWFGLDRSDPYASLDAAAKYDSMLFKQTGSWEKALESYGTLAGASDAKRAEFQAALQGSAPVEGQSVIDSVLSGLKSVWDNSMGGLAQDTYKNLTGQSEQTSGQWDFTKMITGNIGFIVLGIVVIALAILSNNTVRGVASKAITKR